MGSVAILTGEKKFEHFFFQLKIFFGKKKLNVNKTKKSLLQKKLEAILVVHDMRLFEKKNICF